MADYAQATAARHFRLGTSGVLRVRQDPDAKIDYSGTWVDRFPGGTITASTWTIERDGVASTELVVYDDATDETGGLAVSWWLSGGIDGADYKITNHVVMDNGAEDDRSIDVLIRAA